MPNDRPKVVPIHDGVQAINAFLRVNSFARAPHTHEEDEELFMSSRARAYAGQSHTAFGARGQTEVTGVTMRDVGDAVTTTFARFEAKRHRGNVDSDALAMEVLLLIEKMMGIYPNLPERKL